MAGTTGREMKGFAFAKCGTNSWGVAASVTKGTRFQSDGGLKYTPTFVEDRSFGETYLGPASSGDIAPPDLTLSGQARFEDHNYILEALAMGSPVATSTVSSSAAGVAYMHVIDLAPSIDGLAATFAIDRKLYVEELTSAKVYGFGETYGDGGIVNQSFKVLGSGATKNSSVNINSTVYGASYPALGGKVFRNQCVFRINTQSGGSLTATDAIVVEGIEWNFERPQDRTHGTGSRYIVEPADNEFPDVGFTATFTRMNTVSANSLRTALEAENVAYKCDWTYTGTYINSTTQYSKLYQVPYAELQDFEAATVGAAQVKPKAVFRAKKPASAPTGMAGVTNPFRITRVMTNSLVAF